VRQKFPSKLSAFDYNHWQYHFPVPDEVAISMIRDDNRRVLAWFEEEGPFHVALMKAKEYWYILVTKNLRKKLGLNEDSLCNILLEQDQSEYGHEVPEEFEVLLDQDEEGQKYFNSLTPGKQRSLIYLVTKVKNPESRMKKSLAILHHLKVAEGKLDFKQLNEWIKHYNNL
jgi:Uncharacterized protein conserved in bacteria